MPNIKAFRPVIHEKNMFKGCCYINLYNALRAWPFVTPGKFYWNKLESPGSSFTIILNFKIFLNLRFPLNS